MNFNTSRVSPGVWVLVAVIVLVIGLGVYSYFSGAWDLPIE
jgi:hypothetical protein